MKISIAVVLAILAPLSTLAAPSGGVKGNPFEGVKLYANPKYAKEIEKTAVALAAKGDAATAAAARKVKTIPTAAWIDTIAEVKKVSGHLDRALAKNEAVVFVVYDLPNRDCAALASNGELKVSEGGLAKYKTLFIDPIAKQFKAHPRNRIIVVLEPDSLPNLVTNINIDKCKEAEAAYKAGVIYAIKKLALPNVSIYIDAGHAGWLGWPANLGPAAKLFSEIVKGAAPSKIRGFSTNVANYNAFSASSPDPVTAQNVNYDEKHYIEAFTSELTKLGVPANFVVDTSRNGAQNIRKAWGDWCNIVGAGFGIRPTTNTGVDNVDAFFWVKPGGESDGTSDVSSARYDGHCGLADSSKSAPEAGTWFSSYFVQLIKNANPPLK